jgi:hypothetical protein
MSAGGRACSAEKQASSAVKQKRRWFFKVVDALTLRKQSRLVIKSSTRSRHLLRNEESTMRHWFLVLSLVSAASFSAAAAETDVEAVCKAAIAAIMGRDPSIISIDNRREGVINLSYIRKDDNTRWAYRCKVDGNRVIWATDTGRWRTHRMDEKITFTSDASGITITQTFSDGSKSQERFPKE